MCGIFGGIGRVDQKAIRALAVANESRGKDSLGFFCSDQSIWKKAGIPTKLLRDKGFQDYEQKFKDNWFVCGHTRHGTRGAATDKNAHPFQYGPYIGIHNGIIYQAPNKYDVDSMYLWDLLEEHNGDYQKAWGDLPGWWGLAWTDGKSLMLQAHKQTVAIARVNDAVYFSSDGSHLEAVLDVKAEDLTEGETVRFTPDGNFKQLKAIKVKETTWTKGNYGNTSYYSNSAKIGDVIDGYEYTGGLQDEWVHKVSGLKKYGQFRPWSDSPLNNYGGSKKTTSAKTRQETLQELGPLTGVDVLVLDDLSSTTFEELKRHEFDVLMDLEDRFFIFHSAPEKYKARKDLQQAALDDLDAYLLEKDKKEDEDSVGVVKLKHEEIHEQVSKKSTALVPINHTPELWENAT